MNGRIVAMALGCATLGGGGVFAQAMGPSGQSQNQTTPMVAQSPETCLTQAYKLGLHGQSLQAYMYKCTGLAIYNVQHSPAPPPTAQTKWARHCGEEVRDTGLKGAAAEAYLRRCLSLH